MSADAHTGSALVLNGNDKAKALPQGIELQSRGNVLPEVSAAQHEQNIKAYHDKINNPPFHFNGPKDAATEPPQGD